MTCIVGIETEQGAWMAGDSAAATGWDIRQTALSKVFTVGQYTIGYTSSFRMGQILQHQVDYPLCDDPSEKFMVTAFVEMVRKALKDFGYAQVNNNQESGGDFLVMVWGRLFHISSDFQVNRYQNGLYAVGCGAPYALGAMFCGHPAIPPRTLMRMGLSAAATFSNGVTPPFTEADFSERR
jgi:ATP-dependent protease HslVU (ClpYQ) peptidase subunit